MKHLLALPKARLLQLVFLIFCGTFPLFFFLTGNLPSRELRALSFFLTPVVFTDANYSYPRELTFHYKDGTTSIVSPAELLIPRYTLIRRWEGVAVWHFLKYSPGWPDSAIAATLNAYFCPGPIAIKYRMELTTGTRVVEQKCN